MADTPKPEPPDGGEIIYRTTITTRDGRVIHASAYGLRAFPIRVRSSSK